MNRKKITFYMTTILEYGGGFEISFMDTAKLLSMNKDYEVRIVTMDEKFTRRLEGLLKLYYRKSNNVTIRESAENVKKRIGNAIYIKCSTFKELRECLKGSDVVYSKNEILESIILKFFIGKNSIKRLVYSCGTAVEILNAINLTSIIHNLIYKSFIYKLLASGVDHFNVKNSHELMIYSKIFGKNKVTLIPNGFNFNELKKKAQTPFQLKGKKESFKVLWIGRLTQEKGIVDFINIISKTANNDLFNQVEWHIVGEGEERNLVIATTSTFSNVHYYGHINNDSIMSLYRQCNLFISTSYAESFGNTIIESIAVDTPVICRNIPGPNNIVINGVNGLFASTTEDYLNSILKIKDNYKDFKGISNTVESKFSNDARINLLKKTLNL